MKPWAEMTAGARGGVIGAVAAVIAALFYGAWTVSRPPAAVEVTGEVAPSGGDVAEAGDAAAEAAPEAADSAPEATAGSEAEAESAAVAATEPEVAADAPAAEDAVAEDAGAETEVASEAVVEAAPEAAVETAPEAADETQAAEAVEQEVAPVAPAPPSFDLVRVEKDGSALVAGAAAPGSTLSLQITGAEIAAVPADGQGNFVAMFNLAPSPAPRVLSLVMTLADGTEVRSDASVVIAPTVAPVAVAAAEAAPEAEAEVAAEATAEATAEVASAEPAAEVVADVAPAALLVTEEGAKVLQRAESLPADLVANVTIDAITYTAEGAVQLAGRGTAERSVRLYLDNAQLAEVAIGATGDWAVTLPDVAPGVYTLRADQLDAAGQVTSRFETPFKRETVEALAAASAVTEAAAEPAGDVAAVAEDPAAADASVTETAAETAAAETGAETAVADAPAAAPSSVTVQPGFTLWRIATETLGEGVLYVQVFEANKDQIRDPDLIYPGQVFTIPAAE
jgi:nucleoid-associated protein YgaU